MSLIYFKVGVPSKSNLHPATCCSTQASTAAFEQRYRLQPRLLPSPGWELGGSYLSALLPLPLIAGSYHSEPPPLPGSPGAAAAAARDAHGRVRELWDEYYDNFLGSENPFCVLSDDSD